MSSSSEDTARLLSLVPADGSPIGNQRLRESLDWDEDRYLAARAPLIACGQLLTGSGRGGSVRRAVEEMEMFPLTALSAEPPSRPNRPAKQTKHKAAPVAPVTSYRHTDATRKNIPPAGLASKSTVQETHPHRLSYDPHLTPVLLFDGSGQADQLTAKVQGILAKAQSNPLTPEETQLLSDALLRSRQPWLEWAGKREKRWFEVDPVALHIHERVSANAILKAARREDIEHDLFADPKLSREEAMQFYKHDVDWANRLILGDSLQVMSSLARREGLAGKVQMIYIDPPLRHQVLLQLAERGRQTRRQGQQR